MLQLRYVPLVSVQFTHGYYRGGACPDFAVLPTAATAALLQAYDWVARPTAGRLLLLGREDAPGQPTTPLDEPLQLTFVVQLLNPLLPAVSAGAGTGPFYFSNLAADGSFRALLTAGPTLGAADQLPPLLGQQLSLSLEKNKYKQLTLSRVQPGAGLQVVQAAPVEPEHQTATLRVARPGRYTLAKVPADHSAPVPSELYLSDELVAGPPFFGLLALTLSQTPAAPLAYTVALAYRPTTWRYFLVDAKAKTVPVEVDGAGHPDLHVLYAGPVPADPAFPAALSAATPIATQAALLAETQALEQRAADPGLPPGQQQAAQARLRQVRADLALMQALRADPRVRAVYLARLPDPLPVVQYTAPRLTLRRPHANDQVLPVPAADTPNATIFYTF